MEGKNKSTVRIAGLEYVLSADASEEYIHKVALYVDKKMNLIGRERTGLSTAMIAVLAAVNITDELFRAQAELDVQETAKPRAKKQPSPSPEGPLLYDVADITKARDKT